AHSAVSESPKLVSNALNFVLIRRQRSELDLDVESRTAGKGQYSGLGHSGPCGEIGHRVESLLSKIGRAESTDIDPAAEGALEVFAESACDSGRKTGRIGVSKDRTIRDTCNANAIR
ncbi:MAG: hypothetical protein OEQ39_21390, partial [Gammaproteobacteria bacterium]|nr:hypothetical protein [Gammaproteobacteria bacterium]